VSDVGSHGDQSIFDHFAFTLIDLEDRSVYSSVRVHILEGYGVELLVGKETDHATTTIWCRNFADCHRQSANLLVLLSEEHVANRGDLDLDWRASLSLKLQGVVVDRERSSGVGGCALETQDMRGGDVDRRRCGWRLLRILSLQSIANGQEYDQQHHNQSGSRQMYLRVLFSRGRDVIH